MYFYEVIEKCDRQSLINGFLMLCEDSPDIKLTEKKFRKTIESISEIEANTLGCLVDESSLSFYGYEKYAALVLWEMTWFGFDEETIQERMKTWDED